MGICMSKKVRAEAQAREDGADGMARIYKKNDVIIHRFVVSRMLGKGAYGTAYLGKDRSTKNEMVVIKVMEVSDIGPYEAEAMEKTSKNPHWPIFLGTFLINCSTVALVSQYAGKTLHCLMGKKNVKKFNPNNVIRLLCDGVEALEILHRIGFVHRDLKSDNFTFLFSPCPLLNVIDLGICSSLTSSSSKSETPITFESCGHASLSLMDGSDARPHDDIVSLLYLGCELSGVESVYYDEDVMKMRRKKMDLESNPAVALTSAPHLVNFAKELKVQEYHERLDYEKLKKAIVSTKNGSGEKVVPPKYKVGLYRKGWNLD